MIAQTQSATYRQNVGEFQVNLLSDGPSEVNKELLIGATPEMEKRYSDNGLFPNAYNAYLIKTPQLNILVDTGTGAKLQENIAYLGIKPEQINVILLTHMHPDHIGGMLKGEQPAFPNADVYIARQEYDYWTDEETINKLPESSQGPFRLAQKVVTAYKDRLQLFMPGELGTESKDLLPGIRGIAAFGHTPGHTMFLVTSEQNKLLIWGDIAHAMAIQMPHPEVAISYDTDPDQAIATRKKVLEYVSQQDIPIAGMHISYPGIGSIKKDQMGYQFIPAKK